MTGIEVVVVCFNFIVVVGYVLVALSMWVGICELLRARRLIVGREYCTDCGGVGCDGNCEIEIVQDYECPKCGGIVCVQHEGNGEVYYECCGCFDRVNNIVDKKQRKV